ncbi:MAG TPA: hypothetical protein VF549_00390 [Solirubrobacteraceae bacterium]|jgi:hypothetical protein
MTLAYVFWHWPAQRDRYEERLQAFHDSLARPGTTTFRLGVAPWDDVGEEAPYEDWYPVDDWAALGELNDYAVTGPRKPPHDEVAHASRKGAGAVYRNIVEGPPLSEVAFAAWLGKPPAEPPPGAALWQRQLVLGPAPEYAVLAGSAVEVGAGAVLTRPRRVAGV